MLNEATLPEPSASALSTSRQLSEKLAQLVVEYGGHIGFDRYMQCALYEPGLGYYLGPAIRFGEAGDFLTAPQLSPMFGRCVGRQCAEVLERTGGGDIVEFGAGEGHLAAAILGECAVAGHEPERYRIIELNALAAARQRETIGQLAPAQLERVEWLTGLPESPLTGVFVANEIVDAFPVTVFRCKNGSIYERRVRGDTEQFLWHDEPGSPDLCAAVATCVDPDVIERGNYVSEINVGISPWMNDLANALHHGVVLVIDYGYPRQEYYHSSRSQGTLSCHFRHRVHYDPFWYPGLQDITASVDFTAVAETATQCGLNVAGYCSQANFLLACGLLQDAERQMSTLNASDAQRIAHETKVLTLPGEMGESFKVMALTSDYNDPLCGFERRDDRHRL